MSGVGPHLAFGDPGGHPVVFCHGTPGSAEECRFIDLAARRYGLRLLALDRPGYGDCPPAPDLSYGRWAARTIADLDGLGITRYGILAISGGAPNALALAAFDPARVRAVSLVSALGSFAEPTLAEAANAFTRLTLKLARHQLAGLDRIALRPLAALLHALPRAGLVFVRYTNAAADRRSTARAEVADQLIRNLRRALRQGSAGVRRDLKLMVAPWDFTLADVRAPVIIRHGLDDALLKPAHSAWLAGCLPRAELELVPGEGHYSLPFEHGDRILRDLAARLDA